MVGRLYLLTFVAVTVLSACASHEARRDETIVTLVTDAPATYRFDVFGAPSPHVEPTAEEKKMPPHLRMASVMRRYAEIHLRERGVCAQGFVGPDVVLGPENDRNHLFFFVTCSSRG
jgi:hypothetical protein